MIPKVPRVPSLTPSTPLNVLVNWAWNYFTYDRSARLIMHPPRAAQHAEAGPFITEEEPEALKTPHGAH